MVAPTTRESDADDLLTIDQLADATGVSVRTIRFYSGKGLLPAPRLRGRTGLHTFDDLAADLLDPLLAKP